MSGWTRFLAKLGNLVHPSRAERDLNREIEAHLGLIEEEFRERGMPQFEARIAAQRVYGNVTSVTELHREERSLVFLEQTLQDIRYALRSFRQTKSFTVVVILTLALGIGANAAIFSIINTVLLHPLAYPAAGRLVAITSGAQYIVVSFTKLKYMQERTQTLEGIGAYYARAMNLTTQTGPEQVVGARGNFDLFRVLGVSPALGRGFLPEEDQPGGADVAIVTDGFWRSHLGADRSVAGKSISIDGHATIIVGVLPGGFRFPFLPAEPQIWLPRVFEVPGETPQRIYGGMGYLSLIGKSREGQSPDRVNTELKPIVHQYKNAFPAFPDANFPLEVTTLEESLVANVPPSLLALLAAVGFVLLIACVNVANLLLARSASRAKEIGIRCALGAGHGRLTRQLVTESVLLSFLGGTVGVALAALSLPSLMHYVEPGTIPLSEMVRLDPAVLVFAVVISFLTGITFGLVPALHSSRPDLNGMLKEGSRGSTAGGGRLRQLLVISEVALTLTLMTGSGLLIKTVVNLMKVSPGFSPQDVTTFFISLPQTQYPRAEQRHVFYRQLLDQTRALPGIVSTAVVSHIPLGNGPRFFFMCPETSVCQGLGKDPIAAWRQVSPDYFTAMRTPLLSGRVFDERDAAASPLMTIVNKTIADRYFPGMNPLGRHLSNSRERVPMEIVGVVADAKVLALSAASVEEVYVPYTQETWPSMTLVVRSSPGMTAPVPDIRKVLEQLDPTLPLARIQSLDEIVSGSIAQPRLIAMLAGAFALSALLLAAVGIYGVVAYLVTQRSAEIAIRMALGAQRWTIFRLMAGHGMRLVVAGLVLGLAASLAMTRLLSALLFGTSPTDFATMAAATLMFVLVGFAACYIPSRRATRLDALLALRCA